MLIVVHLVWILCLLSLFKGQTSGFTNLNNYHTNNTIVICMYSIKCIQSKYNIISPNWKAHKIYIINWIKYHNYSNNSQEFNIYHSVSLLHHAIPLSLPISLECLFSDFSDVRGYLVVLRRYHHGTLWHRLSAPGGVIQRLSPWRGEPVDACARRSQMYDIHNPRTLTTFTVITVVIILFLIF